MFFSSINHRTVSNTFCNFIGHTTCDDVSSTVEDCQCITSINNSDGVGTIDDIDVSTDVSNCSRLNNTAYR